LEVDPDRFQIRWRPNLIAEEQQGLCRPTIVFPPAAIFSHAFYQTPMRHGHFDHAVSAGREVLYTEVSPIYVIEGFPDCIQDSRKALSSNGFSRARLK